TLLQRLAHKAEFVIFQIAQPAMDQLGAGGGGVGREVVLLHQQHGEPAPRCVPGDAGAVDAAADDQKVSNITLLPAPCFDVHSPEPAAIVLNGPFARALAVQGTMCMSPGAWGGSLIERT